MSLNPYHLVSGQVKYSNPEEMEKISEKLKELNNNEINNNILENKTYFFKNSNLKNNKIGKFINSTYVQLNEKIDYESDFIWRILSMIKRVRGYTLKVLFIFHVSLKDIMNYGKIILFF